MEFRLSVHWSDVAWGDVPTWFEAIGTVAAFMLAVWLYWRSLREREREQARRVSAWQPGGITETPPGLPVAGTPMIANQTMLSVLIHIHNGSDELISDVRAFVVHADDGSEFDSSTRLTYTDIGPGKDIELHSAVPKANQRLGPLRVAVEFTDASGRRWRRVGGSLTRLP